MEGVHWWEVSFSQYKADPCELAARLYTIGSHGVYLREKKGLCFHPDFVREETPVLYAYFPFSAGQTVAILEEKFPGAVIEARPVSEKELNDHENGRVLKIGDFTICPPWYKADPGKRHFSILSGIAFGSGSHPTTQLGLMWISSKGSFLKGKKLLDCGSGTGILSVAAASLGAKVTAVDIQMKAALVTQHNVRANGFSCADVRVICCDVRDINGRFQVIVANLITPVLGTLIEHLFSLLEPGGTLFITGVMKGEEKLLEKELPGEVKDVMEHRGWIGYELWKSGGIP